MARGTNFYNAGSDVIQAYLRGKQLDDARKEDLAKAEIARMQAELRQQEITEATHRFTTKLQQDRDIANSRLDLEKQRVNLQAKQLGIAGLRAIQSGEMEGPDGQPIQVGKILSGDPDYFNKLTIPTQAVRDQREVDKAVNKEKAIQAVKLPYEREQALLKGEIAANAQERLFNFQRTEKSLDRANVLEAARLRAQATRENAAATREEKRAVEDEAADIHAASILDGSSTLEEIHKLGQIGVKAINRAKAAGVRPINNKDRDGLIALGAVQRFYDKAKTLNELLQKGNLADQATSSTISDLQEQLQVDLTGFARMVGEKGVISDRDIVRMKGAIPKILPGGVRSLLSEEGRKKSNNTRVREIEKLYFEKKNSILKGIPPSQLKALEERYELLSQEEEIPD